MPQTKDQKRRKAADLFAKAIYDWRNIQNRAEEYIAHTKNANPARQTREHRIIANALDKIGKLRVHEQNTRAAIGR